MLRTIIIYAKHWYQEWNLWASACSSIRSPKFYDASTGAIPMFWEGKEPMTKWYYLHPRAQHILSNMHLVFCAVLPFHLLIVPEPLMQLEPLMQTWRVMVKYHHITRNAQYNYNKIQLKHICISILVVSIMFNGYDINVSRILMILYTVSSVQYK